MYPFYLLKNLAIEKYTPNKFYNCDPRKHMYKKSQKIKCGFCEMQQFILSIYLSPTMGLGSCLRRRYPVDCKGSSPTPGFCREPALC